MDAINLSNTENGKTKHKKSEIDLNNIKSNLILNKIFTYLTRKRFLKIIKINKAKQKKLNISINSYKEYSEIFSDIVIEMTPKKDKSGKFINIPNQEIKDVSFFHIYFNDEQEEIKRYYLNQGDNISKIKIIINYHIKSFYELFKYCTCIESIYFKKFYRKNINNMHNMFYECSSLKEINISNFNTNNVKDMSGMFYECSLLKDLNLPNFGIFEHL